MLGHTIPPKSTHSELTNKKKPTKLLGVNFQQYTAACSGHKFDVTVSTRQFPR